jgi:predicted tellurium resistance membrane protein TerC
MNIVLWSAQVALAALFAFAGLRKAATPIGKLREKMPGMSEISGATTRFIGVAEVAGAAGLIMPWATGVAPFLTPLAAAALVLVMILAARFHGRRGEWSGVGINVVLGALAAFVAWGRF